MCGCRSATAGSLRSERKHLISDWRVGLHEWNFPSYSKRSGGWLAVCQIGRVKNRLFAQIGADSEWVIRRV